MNNKQNIIAAKYSNQRGAGHYFYCHNNATVLYLQPVDSIQGGKDTLHDTTRCAKCINFKSDLLLLLLTVAFSDGSVAMQAAKSTFRRGVSTNSTPLFAFPCSVGRGYFPPWSIMGKTLIGFQTTLLGAAPDRYPPFHLAHWYWRASKSSLGTCVIVVGFDIWLA